MRNIGKKAVVSPILILLGVLIAGFFVYKQFLPQAVYNPFQGQDTKEQIAHSVYFPSMDSPATTWCTDTTELVAARTDKSTMPPAWVAVSLNLTGEPLVPLRVGSRISVSSGSIVTAIRNACCGNTGYNAHRIGWVPEERGLRAIIKFTSGSRPTSLDYYLCDGTFEGYMWWNPCAPKISTVVYSLNPNSVSTPPSGFDSPASQDPNRESFYTLNQKMYLCMDGDVVLKTCNTDSYVAGQDCDYRTPCGVQYFNAAPVGGWGAKCAGDCVPGRSICSNDEKTLFSCSSTGALTSMTCGIKCVNSTSTTARCINCNLGERQCAGSQWQQCNDLSLWQKIDCSGEGCSLTSGTIKECLGTCMEPVSDQLFCSTNCSAGDKKCALNAQGYSILTTCNSAGQQGYLFTQNCTYGCDVTGYGGCKPFCTPDKTTCAGNTKMVCSESSKTVTPTTCLFNCSMTTGYPLCINNCTAGNELCSGSARQNCSRVPGTTAEGKNWLTYYACASPSTCVQLSNTQTKCSATCGPGEKRCGTDTYNQPAVETCSTNLEKFEITESCPLSETSGCGEFSPSPTIPPIISCLPFCNTDRTKCAGNVSYKCSESTKTTSSVTCRNGCQADMAGVSSCTNECSASQARCNPANSKERQSCTVSNDGNYWAFSATCPGNSVCNSQAPSTCTSVCNTGDKKCGLTLSGVQAVLKCNSDRTGYDADQPCPFTNTSGCKTLSPTSAACGGYCEDKLTGCNGTTKVVCNSATFSSSYTKCSFGCQNDTAGTPRCTDTCGVGTQRCNPLINKTNERQNCYDETRPGIEGDYWLTFDACLGTTTCESLSPTQTQCTAECPLGDQRCSDNQPQLCSNAGAGGTPTWTAKTPSQLNCVSSCIQTGTSPTRTASCQITCADKVCIGKTLYSCRSDGQGPDSARPSQDCTLACDAGPAPAHCRKNANCDPQPTNGVFCLENDVYRCSDDSQTTSFVQSCPLNETKGCLDGGCLRACGSVDNQCVGGIPWNCRSDLTGLEAGGACPFGSTCSVDLVDGRAKCSKVCLAGNERCAGSQREKCSTDGFFWQPVGSPCERGCSAGQGQAGLNFSTCNQTCEYGRLSCFEGNVWSCQADSLNWNKGEQNCKGNPCLTLTDTATCQRLCTPSTTMCGTAKGADPANSYVCNSDGLTQSLNETCLLFCNTDSGNCENVKVEIAAQNFAFGEKLSIPISVKSDISQTPLDADLTLKMFRDGVLKQEIKGAIGASGQGAFEFNLITDSGAYELQIEIRRDIFTSMETQKFQIILSRDVIIASSTSRVIYQEFLSETPIEIRVSDAKGNIVDVASFKIKPDGIVWQKDQDVLGLYKIILPSSTPLGDLKLNITPIHADRTVLTTQIINFEIKQGTIKVVHDLPTTAKAGSVDVVVDAFDVKNRPLDADKVKIVLTDQGGTEKVYEATRIGGGRFVKTIPVEKEGTYTVEIIAEKGGLQTGISKQSLVVSKTGNIKQTGEGVIVPDSGVVAYARQYWYVLAGGALLAFIIFKKGKRKRR